MTALVRSCALAARAAALLAPPSPLPRRCRRACGRSPRARITVKDGADETQMIHRYRGRRLGHC
jgi:hypothetical protein